MNLDSNDRPVSYLASVLLAERGLRAFWVLQHQKGYKPIVFRVSLTRETLPEINFDKCN